MGPAALARAHRFISDTRISQDQKSNIFNRIKESDGIPMCEKHFVCNRVCPKGVKPGTAIKNIREKYLSS